VVVGVAVKAASSGSVSWDCCSF